MDSSEQERAFELDVVRLVAMSALALVATLAAVALLAPRRDRVRLSVAVGAAARTPDPPPVTKGAAAEVVPAAAGTPAPGSAKDTSLTANEPVVAQSLVTVVLLAAGVLGINTTSGLQESLLNIAVPLVPVLGALFARSRVSPLPRSTGTERPGQGSA